MLAFDRSLEPRVFCLDSKPSYNNNNKGFLFLGECKNECKFEYSAVDEQLGFRGLGQ